MECKPVQTANAPSAIGPYSQAIVAGSFLFVSGQLGLNPKTGDLAGPEFSAQVRQSLENLKQIVQAGGSRMDRVISVDVFLDDMAHFTEFNAIYETYFKDHRPARAVVEVAALPKNAAVEIKCVAGI